MITRVVYFIMFLTGIFVSAFFFKGPEFLTPFHFLLISAVFLTLGFIFRRCVGVVSLCLFFVGVFYFQGRVLDDSNYLNTPYYVGSEISFLVQIDAEVDARVSGQKLIVKVLDNGEGQKLKGRILLEAYKYDEFEYGDRFYVSGFLEEPFETEDFSYKNYLRRYQVYGIVKRPYISDVEAGVNNVFYKLIFAFKVQVQKRINELFLEPYASFESGLLLGARKGIPDFLMDAFNITGLTHIIAISGYNISLVIVLVSGAFSNVRRELRAVLSLIFVIAFTILVGMSAAVVRAAIMGSIGLVALMFGRSTYVTLTLIMSAAFMNIVNPLILPYDVGFQLSFAATCGVIYVAPYLEKYMQWCPSIFAIRESLQLTLAAQATTLPVIVWHFGRFSLISPIANVLVAPFIPLSMTTGAFAVLFSYISGFFSEVFIGFTWFFLEVIIQITLFLANVPYAQLQF